MTSDACPPTAAGVDEPLPVDVVIPAWGAYLVAARRAMASVPDVARHIVVTDQRVIDDGIAAQAVIGQGMTGPGITGHGLTGHGLIGHGLIGHGLIRLGVAGVPLSVVARPAPGLGAARNAGLSHCDAEFVVFLDADDAMIPGALAALVRVARARPDADVFFGQFLRSDGVRWPSARAARLMASPVALPLLLSRNTLPMTGALLRRRAVPADLFPSVRSEDWVAAVRMRARGRVVFVDRAVLDYTVQVGSRSRSRIARAEIVATRRELLPAVVRERGAPRFWRTVDRVADRRRRRLDADLATYDDVQAGPGALRTHGAGSPPQ